MAIALGNHNRWVLMGVWGSPGRVALENGREEDRGKCPRGQKTFPWHWYGEPDEVDGLGCIANPHTFESTDWPSRRQSGPWLLASTTGKGEIDDAFSSSWFVTVRACWTRDGFSLLSVLVWRSRYEITPRTDLRRGRFQLAWEMEWCPRRKNGCLRPSWPGWVWYGREFVWSRCCVSS